MGFGIVAKIGIVFAVGASILAAYVAPKWDGKETVTYNVLVYIILPLLFPKAQTVMDKPIDVQAEHWAKLTRFMAEQSGLESNVKSNGEAYHRAAFGPNPTRITNFTIPSVEDADHSIPVSCACPHDATMESKLPVVFYFFGGGFILGAVETEFPLARWLAQESEAVVCAIGYRLAPKYPYPTPVNDAIDASVAILEQKVSLESLLGTGVDYTRAAAWGTSAGGYMAAQTARRLTARGHHFKCQVSITPMAKPNGGTQSVLKNWNDVWSGPHNTYAWSVFLPGDDGTLAMDWKVSLLFDPPREVVAKLPPTFIQIHSRDVLHDEGEM
jgi:acetyl esterase